jgi:hypothetical protein
MSKQFLIALLLLAALPACKKDEDPIPDPTPDPHPNTVISTSFTFVRAGAPFDQEVPFTDSANTLIKIDRIMFYMAQPFFLNDNGDTVAKFDSRYHLIDLDEAGLIRTIGQLDGHLHTMHFGLGVDSVTNHLDITTQSEPLNDYQMWWDWATGHRFLLISGRYDSDNNNSITGTDFTFSYECGFDVLYDTAEVEVHTDADIGGDVIIPLELNVDSLMAGMDVAVQPNVHIVNPISIRLMRNLRTAISHPE